MEEEEQINDKKEKSEEKKATITKNENKKKEEDKDKLNMNKSMNNDICIDIYKSSGELKYTIESTTSTNNTTRIDDSNFQLIEEQSQEKQTEESHVLRRIGVILLGFVISVLFIAAVTFALAAIPGVGPVIGGVLGKTFVDAATLSIGSGVSLGWVAGGIGALFAFISGVFFVKTLWTSECVEESKKVEEDNDKEEEVKEEDENIGHDWVTSLLQKDYEADVEESETESKIESREQQNPIVKSSFCKKFGKLSDQDKKTIHKPLTESPVFFRNTEVKFKGEKKQNQNEK